MKKSLSFSIIFIFSSFTVSLFGLFGWGQSRTQTIRQYLEEENKKTTNALNAIQEKYMKVAEQHNSEIANLPANLAIIFMQAEAAKIMNNMISEAAPTMLRSKILEKMCECIDNTTNLNLSDLEKIKNCLKNTTDFIEQQYITPDSYEDKAIAVQEFKKLEKELNDKMAATHKK